jgi:hypothetical protein
MVKLRIARERLSPQMMAAEVASASGREIDSG